MTRPIVPCGPVMIDVNAFRLTDEEKQHLLDPVVGGMILFHHNFKNVVQLKELVHEIKAVRTPELIMTVDHEGGRVQCFIDDFIRLPIMNVLGRIWDEQDPAAAKAQTEQVGWVLAAELSACGVDLSSTPVLGLDWEQCAVIDNRSFHHDAEAVAELVLALQKGLDRSDMKSCGKHLPGHGFVEGDSHYVLPQDDHSTVELEAADTVPFRRMSTAGMTAVMPAYMVYPQVDGNPARSSAKWLKDILRRDIGFEGVIFSDDLTMEGVRDTDGIKERARVSSDVGCDIMLVCNRPDSIDELGDGFDMSDNAELTTRRQYMANMSGTDEVEKATRTEAFRAAREAATRLASPKDTEGGVKVDGAF